MYSYRAGKKLEIKNNKKCRFPASRLNFEALCSLPLNPNLNSQLKFDENFSNARRRIWSHPYIFVHIWFELFRIKLAKQYCISRALHAESDFQKLVFCYVQELPDKLRILSFYTQRLALFLSWCFAAHSLGSANAHNQFVQNAQSKQFK